MERFTNISIQSLKREKAGISPEYPNQEPVSDSFLTSTSVSVSVSDSSQVHSPLTGRMEIEDVQLESAAESDTHPTWRRLFFSRNIGLVQSEALLVYPLRGGGDGDGVRKPKRKGGKREKERQAAKLAAAASEEKMESSLGAGVKIEYSHLACGYHVGVVAGLALIQPQMAKRLGEGREVREQSTHGPHPDVFL